VDSGRYFSGRDCPTESDALGSTPGSLSDAPDPIPAVLGSLIGGSTQKSREAR
jgi:hypothetical protein